MLYRRRDFMSEAGVFLDDFAADPEATADAALGRIVQDNGWTADEWEKMYERVGSGLEILAAKCLRIAAELRRQKEDGDAVPT